MQTVSKVKAFQYLMLQYTCRHSRSAVSTALSHGAQISLTTFFSCVSFHETSDEEPATLKN